MAAVTHTKDDKVKILKPANGQLRVFPNSWIGPLIVFILYVSPKWIGETWEYWEAETIHTYKVNSKFFLSKKFTSIYF